MEPVLRLSLPRRVHDRRETARSPHLQVEAEGRALSLFLDVVRRDLAAELLLGRRFVDDGDLQREIRVRPRAEEARRRVRIDFTNRCGVRCCAAAQRLSCGRSRRNEYDGR